MNKLELMDKVSHLQQQINEEKYKKQRLIQDIQVKRKVAEDLRKQRDDFNKSVKEFSDKAKVHREKRDEINIKIQELKNNRAEIGKKIVPHAKKIKNEKEERKKLNYLAYGTLDSLKKEFDAALKTLFDFDLSLRDEAIMLEMVQDFHNRYILKKEAQQLHEEIHDEWKDIKGIEEEINTVTQQIIDHATQSQLEHNSAMELFERKEEARKESDEIHKEFISTSKDINEMQKEIDQIKGNVDELNKELMPLRKNLHKFKITRWEEQKLEKLKTAQTKIKSTGKIDLEDLRVLMESGTLKFNKKKKNAS